VLDRSEGGEPGLNGVGTARFGLGRRRNPEDGAERPGVGDRQARATLSEVRPGGGGARGSGDRNGGQSGRANEEARPRGGGGNKNQGTAIPLPQDALHGKPEIICNNNTSLE